MKLSVIFLLTLFASIAASTTIYKRVEADGTIVYSDIPTAKSEMLDLENYKANVIPRLAVASSLQANKKNQKDKHSINYQLNIIGPSAGQTIRDNSGNLAVTGKLEPSGKGTYSLELNGELFASANSPSFLLHNVPRGAHQLQIHFKDNLGKILASSPIQKVFLHRATVLNRAN